MNARLMLIAALTCLTACAPQSSEDPPVLNKGSAVEHTVSGSLHPGQVALDLPVLSAGLHLPEGFEAQIVHEVGWESRELFIRRDGDLFVSLSGKRDGPHILGLRDTDGDHDIDETTEFFEVITPREQKVPRIHIAYHDDHLYAVTNEQVIRMPLPPGALVPTGPEETVIASIPYQSSHRGRTITISPDGWLYVNIGGPSNACQTVSKTLHSPGMDPCPELDQHGGIWRWPADQLNQPRDAGERYATGIRNSIAHTFDPVHDGLFVGQMGRDRLDTLWPEHFTAQQNADLPGEEFFEVEEGADYGWPYCYWDPFLNERVLAPEYGGDGEEVGRCADMARPALSFPAHWSPSSIAFYHGEALPERYHGGAFVALKGSWNRAPLPQDGFVVAFVPFENGRPTGDWEVFADGFKGFDILYERSNAVYRPQSIAIHPDGSVYILDNNEGRIWRITYTGVSAPARTVSADLSSDRELITEASMGPGQEIYLQYCATCHMAEGGGVPGEFPPLVGTDWVSGDKGRLIRAVLHGMDGPVEIAGEMYDEIMPGHGFLDDDDMAALLTYIRAEFGGTNDPILEAEVTLVRNGDPRELPWPAQELETRTGIPGRP